MGESSTGVLLGNYEKGLPIICENMPDLPGE